MSSLNQNQLSAARSKVPSPNNVEYVRHTDGDTSDIIDVILYADKYKDYMNSKDMANVAARLRSDDPMQTLYNVWYFVKHNIEYKADKVGEERIKDAKVLWDMRVGDCKSFSLMIGSILRNYKDIGFSYRFVGYKSGLFRTPDYTHVYVIAEVKGRSKPVIIDSTINDFNYEVPYSINKDYKMTRIVHMTGVKAPNFNKGAIPTQAQRFADAPRRAIRVPDIKNIPSLTEGQLSLNLLFQSLQIDEAYYGPSKGINEGKLLIDRALKTGSNAITGYVDTPLGMEIASMVDMYGRRNYGALSIPPPDFSSSIKGPDDIYVALSNCVKKFPNAKGYIPDVELYQKLVHNYPGTLQGKIIGFEGLDGRSVSRNTNQANQVQLANCFWEALTIPEFFNTDKFVQGSHQLLYAFNKDKYKDQKVITKAILHESSIGAMANISGLSLENVMLYTANGIKQTAAANKLSIISPEGNIDLLAQSRYLDNAQIKGPAEAAKLIHEIGILIKVLASAVVAVIGALALLKPDKANQMRNNGFDTPTTTPSIDDFNKIREDAEKAESTNNYILLGAGLLAAGLIAMPSSNKKS